MQHNPPDRCLMQSGRTREIPGPSEALYLPGRPGCGNAREPSLSLAYSSRVIFKIIRESRLLLRPTHTWTAPSKHLWPSIEIHAFPGHCCSVARA